MTIPKLSLAAIFPEPVTAGVYEIRPPTLLHLAAIDRLGVQISGGRIGADAAATAGFILTRTADELFALMALPQREISAACCAWCAAQSPRDYADLNRGVVEAINAAFATAVPGSDADFQTGRPQTSDGPSK
jgi:hypothetical protein